MAARRSSVDLVALVRRRFFRSTLQPIAENLEYNPASIAARYRSNYLGSISLPSVQQASYSAAPDKPTRETGKTSPHDDAPANENTVPPVGSQDKHSGGKASKVRVHTLFVPPGLEPSGCRTHPGLDSSTSSRRRFWAIQHFLLFFGRYTARIPAHPQPFLHA